MTNSTELLIKLIDELPTTITLADVAQVEYLNRIFKTLDKDQLVFVTNSQKLTDAVKAAEQLRIDNPDTPENPGDTTSNNGDTKVPDDSGNTPSDTTNGASNGGESGCGGCSGFISALAMIPLAGWAMIFVKKKAGGNADA